MSVARTALTRQPEQTPDRQVNAAQAAAGKTAAAVNSTPWGTGGVQIKAVKFVGGVNNSVSHKLGRVPSGWMTMTQVSPLGPAVPIQISASATALVLLSGSPGICDLWVW